jgi:hypothetical protein
MLALHPYIPEEFLKKVFFRMHFVPTKSAIVLLHTEH